MNFNPILSYFSLWWATAFLFSKSADDFLFAVLYSYLYKIHHEKLWNTEAQRFIDFLYQPVLVLILDSFFKHLIYHTSLFIYFFSVYNTATILKDDSSQCVATVNTNFEITHLITGSDGLTLLVVLLINDCPHAHFYDVRAFTSSVSLNLTEFFLTNILDF